MALHGVTAAPKARRSLQPRMQSWEPESPHPTPLPFSIGQTPRLLDQDAVITSTVSPSIAFSPVYSSGLLSNPHSSCQATLSFSSGSGTGSVDTTVTASNPAGLQSCSGLFYAIATYNGAVSPGGTLVRVPPQVLVQMLYGESHGQGAIGDHVSQMAVGEVVKNRFAQPARFGSVSTYQAAITPSQFFGIATQITDGAKPDVINAGRVFSDNGVSVANAGCFFSPTYNEWLQIYSALVTQTTVMPTLVNDTDCYQEQKQLIFKLSVGYNADGRNAPAFIFEQERNLSEPAVIQIP